MTAYNAADALFKNVKCVAGSEHFSLFFLGQHDLKNLKVIGSVTAAFEFLCTCSSVHQQNKKLRLKVTPKDVNLVKVLIYKVLRDLKVVAIGQSNFLILVCTVSTLISGVFISALHLEEKYSCYCLQKQFRFANWCGQEYLQQEQKQDSGSGS